MKSIRARLSYANVMSTIAVFAVLGGGAWAASKIGTNDIKNGAVTAKKLHDNAVKAAKLREAAVTGTKVKDNSLTGKDINELTMGEVPEAHFVNGSTLGFTHIQYNGNRPYILKSQSSAGVTLDQQFVDEPFVTCVKRRIRSIRRRGRRMPLIRATARSSRSRSIRVETSTAFLRLHFSARRMRRRCIPGIPTPTRPSGPGTSSYSAVRPVIG